MKEKSFFIKQTSFIKGKPVKGGIDPYNKLIDRMSDDNVTKVEVL